ncbi:MAG: hypothetical protein ACLFVJ_22450 [Persicimonas sp.]
MNISAVSTVARALIAAVALAAISCASAPNVGVRPAFEKKQIPRIAVVPFYALGSFSLSDEQINAVIEASEQSAIDALREDGFEVVEPRAFRQHLTEHDIADEFDDGVLLRSSLSSYFEPADASEAQDALEVETIRRLYERDELPAEALLFGEVVYHTETNCRVDPTEYNPQADVHRTGSAADAATSGEASPCVVSHFQAKLVYAPTGETMWFNQKLLQTHLDAPDADVDRDRENLALTIQRTLGGAHGIAAFRGPSRQTRTADNDQAKLDEDDEGEGEDN